MWLIKLGYRGLSNVEVSEAILEAGEAAEAIRIERKERKIKKELICPGRDLNSTLLSLEF